MNSSSQDFAELLKGPSKLAATFDALARGQRGPLARPPRLPYFVIALLALLCSGLFVATLHEDRNLQRETMQRDIDLTALQMGGHLTGLTESLTSLVHDIGKGTLTEAQFDFITEDLVASHEELGSIEFVDPRGLRAWPRQGLAAARGAQPGTSAIAPEDEITALIDRVRRGTRPVYATLQPGPRNTPLALAIPLHADREFIGAVVARFDPHDLIVKGASQRALQNYRLAFTHAGKVLASTSSIAAPESALTHTVGIPPLPAEYQLTAAAFRLESRFTASAMTWAVGGLTIAVLVALASLALHTKRQRRIDRALRAETSLRRAMEDAQATGLYVIDPDGAIRYVNRAFCLLSGFAENELLGRGPPYPFWPEDHSMDYRQQLERLLEGEAQPRGREAILRHRDGTPFHASVHETPLLDDDNRRIGWMASATDVTESARARADLAASHKRFTTVLESLDAAVSVCAPRSPDDPTREVLFANRAYLNTFGAGAEGHQRLAQRLRGRETGEAHDSVTDRWFDVRERAIDWPFGAPANPPDARLQIASDITARKAADELARQQQEQIHFTSRLMTMGEMASSLAHELNQPLTAIANYCQGSLSRLKGENMTSDEVKGALEKTSAQAKRAAGIIRRIRNFVKRSEPQRRATPPQQIVEDAVAFAEIEAAKKGVAISAHIDADVGPLLVDPLLIEQLLLNLVKNAMDAIESTPVRKVDILVRRAAEPDMAEFSVTDSGCGIPAENLPRLFEPFFSTKADGMGMGLNICRSIVEFHHGRLTVEGNPASTGTIMRFALPMAGATHAEPVSTSEKVTE
jgi:PAS domain S-box-containing protein